MENSENSETNTCSPEAILKVKLTSVFRYRPGILAEASSTVE
jgi:hypothetical protein